MNNPTERRNLGNGIIATSPARPPSAQQLRIKRLTPDAVLPTKAHATDSGFDLYAAENVVVCPGESAVVLTGIAIELPQGFEATIRPRSGITSKTKLRVQLGTIDNSYTGELGVIVDNIAERSNSTVSLPYLVNGALIDSWEFHGDNEVEYGSYAIRKGDRIAQLVVTQLPQFEAVEVSDFTNASTRGTSGFGSSGVRQ